MTNRNTEGRQAAFDPCQAHCPGSRLKTPGTGSKPALLDYWSHALAVTGSTVEVSQWLKRRDLSQTLEAQTREIARRLSLAGIQARRELMPGLSIVGVCSGAAQPMTAWRNINFLPSVAAANRSQLLKSFQYFSESRRYLRYLVITNGERCGVNELRSRLVALVREISRWASSQTLKDLGITVELRISEITAQREINGEISYHPHANVIIDCARKTDWQRFLRFTHDFFTGHLRDCGRLVEADEAIKYFIKPAEIMEHHPHEMAYLYLATEGVRMAAPMGNLKKMIADLKWKSLKLAKKRNGEDWQWCFVKKCSNSKREKSRSDPNDQILTKLAAQPRFTNIFEPCLIVKDYCGDVSRLLEKNFLADKFSDIRRKYAAAAASPIRFTPSRQLPDECGQDPRRKVYLLKT